MIRAGLVQMRSGRGMARNLADAAELIRQARAEGADVVSTPEMTNILEPDRPRLRALARPEAEDESVRHFAVLAGELGIWLNIGSLALRGAGDRLVNRSFLFAPDGSIAARYDKIHLFDVDLPSGESLRESHAYESGASAVLADTALGPIGLTICYDIRFPSLYRALAKAGAKLFTVPSAFTVPTGEAHWHVLLRARAIEREASCWRPRKAESMSRAARPMAIRSSSRPGAKCWARPEPIPAWCWRTWTSAWRIRSAPGSRRCSMTARWAYRS